MCNFISMLYEAGFKINNFWNKDILEECICTFQNRVNKFRISKSYSITWLVRTWVISADIFENISVKF